MSQIIETQSDNQISALQQILAEKLPHSVQLKIPFLNVKQANIVYNSLRVDHEPKRGGTQKTLAVEGDVLVVTICSSEPRILRVALGTFFDHLILATKTIEMFAK